eukprot:5625902-Pleurochrysis_carterae.AAC.1
MPALRMTTPFDDPYAAEPGFRQQARVSKDRKGQILRKVLYIQEEVAGCVPRLAPKNGAGGATNKILRSWVAFEASRVVQLQMRNAYLTGHLELEKALLGPALPIRAACWLSAQRIELLEPNVQHLIHFPPILSLLLHPAAGNELVLPWLQRLPNSVRVVYMYVGRIVCSMVIGCRSRHVSMQTAIQTNSKHHPSNDDLLRNITVGLWSRFPRFTAYSSGLT